MVENNVANTNACVRFMCLPTCPNPGYGERSTPSMFTAILKHVAMSLHLPHCLPRGLLILAHTCIMHPLLCAYTPPALCLDGASRTSPASISEGKRGLLFSIDDEGSDCKKANSTVVTILGENQFEEYHIPKRVVIVRLDVPKPQPSVQLQWCGH